MDKVKENNFKTLDNSFSQTGANTFSTGTGNVSLNGTTTVTGSNTFNTGTGNVTFSGGASFYELGQGGNGGSLKAYFDQWRQSNLF